MNCKVAAVLGLVVASSCRHASTSGVSGGNSRAIGPAMSHVSEISDAPPATRTVDDVVDVFGERVRDPYRWLENIHDQEVTTWMTAQDKFARANLAKLPGREQMAKRLAELSYIDSVSAPYHRGNRYFYSRSHRDKEKDVHYVRTGEDGAEQVLLDPNAMSDDGSVSVQGIMPSESGRYVAYRVSRNNADAATLYVRDLETGKDLERDVIRGARYAYASWRPDEKGFFYINLPEDPSIPPAELPGHAEVRYHALGTDPTTDLLVVPANHDPTQFVSTYVSRDGRWLFVSRQHGWTSNDVYFRDLHKHPVTAGASEPAPGKPESPWTSLAVGEDAVFSVVPWKDRFYILTNAGAPRYKVLVADPRKPARKNWRELVPESEAVLDGVDVIGNHLVLSYLRDVHSEMEVRDLGGKFVRKIGLPGLGTASGMIGNPDEDDAYFYFSSFTQTPTIYRTSIATGATSLWEKVEIPVDTSRFLTEQLWYPSNDGTTIPMFVIRDRNTRLDGKAPTLLTAYGGFNVSLLPEFSARAVMWVENGGIYAVANLRGGGEFGDAWHRSGMLDKKQNVFDDFLGAAQFLVDRGYTSPARLGILGGSNGGLLVGAAMTQRPELFGAVVCAVPLLDMIRYHLFGAGKTWIAEYGAATDAHQFANLFRYSPYHNVKDDIAYPPLLLLSADSDDRVDPMHARKFVAAIQAANAAAGARERAAWLRIERNAGHGGADLIKQEIETSVDTLSFLLHQLRR